MHKIPIQETYEYKCKIYSSISLIYQFNQKRNVTADPHFRAGMRIVARGRVNPARGPLAGQQYPISTALAPELCLPEIVSDSLSQNFTC